MTAVNESDVWDARHPPKVSGVPSKLLEDEDPATTIKGLGFKNAAVAHLTIRLSGQPGAAYKQYWTIRAMLERARYHPAQTQDMREAMAVFEAWLRDRPESPEVRRSPEEMEQRRVLAASHANAHARSTCGSDEEHAQLLAADQRDARHRLAAAARGPRGVRFALSATSFVAAFGSPGEHGYGMQRCDRAAADGLALFRCSCSFTSWHTVHVESAACVLGLNFQPQQFELRFDGSVAEFRGLAPRGQSTLAKFVAPCAQGESGENVVGDGQQHAIREAGSCDMSVIGNEDQGGGKPRVSRSSSQQPRGQAQHLKKAQTGGQASAPKMGTLKQMFTKQRRSTDHPIASSSLICVDD
eukprot:gb/GFBE01054054.1/.p1 GENE.gb/GFBE01054054.1/~~gb/GFBE01054054.1/.p1  ORF type:complete len:355 (+),score=49.84 gb/GFBE01054054.1/:1-1065(+)